LYINGKDISATYQVFQTEEDYQIQWKLETPIRGALIAKDGAYLTYSSLYINSKWTTKRKECLRVL
jgi:hypothetical protein